ncbi:ferredoxin [Mycolicibacter nonchromogenicus]|uniref:Ferredoxin n=1 Tax=Mycolicibacter nonchromogenicus TaxID=1782 RepID=A0A1X1ZDL2_MYCNO|nr:ferredoxin [Mycolicibacter nonchromogenicus]ORW21261.1 ferredoxin [Mycolicibacter nonchromogenicus]
MRAIVDHDRCEGHGRCYAVAPDLFDLDDEGYTVVHEITVPAQWHEEAREAASACPRAAIRLVD